MAKASDNDFPSLLFTGQASAPTAPASGKVRLYFKTDDKLYKRVSGGTETEIGAAASINSFETIAVAGQSDVVADSATDTLTLAAGTNSLSSLPPVS